MEPDETYGGHVDEDIEEENGGAAPRWTGGTPPTGSIFIDTGRGQAVEVQEGAPFQETVERVANEANYGGWFKVFLNGEELQDPSEAPDKLELGMRVAVTSYDKVG